MQRHGKPVELQLADILDVLLSGQLVDTPLPVAQLLLVVGVVEREHGRRVWNFEKSFARLAADTLRGGIRRDQLGMGGLELLQFLHQPVEFGVADLGIVENVVAILVIANLVAKLVDLSLNVGSRSHFFDYSGTLEPDGLLS